MELFMRKIIIAIILILMGFSALNCSAGNKVQWQKFMNDTTKRALYGNWLFEGCAIDSSNNIYVAYSLNGYDTSMSVISKLSPSGELLWRTTVVPFSLNLKITTRTSYQTHLFVDKEQNLIFVTSGFDTTDNFILLSKWGGNGELLSQKFDYEVLVNGNLSDICITDKDEIFVLSNLYSNSLLAVKGYNNNFGLIYTDSIYCGTTPNGGQSVGVSDSFVSVSFAFSNFNLPNTMRMFQKNRYTSFTSWQYTRDYKYSPIKLEYKFNELYVYFDGIEKISKSTGSLVSYFNIGFISHAIFDTVNNFIYVVVGNRDIYKLDSNLVPTGAAYYCTFDINSLILKNDTITIVNHFNSTITNLEKNRVSTARLDTALNLLSNFNFYVPYPAKQGSYYGVAKVDNNSDLVFVCETISESEFDSVTNHLKYATPINIQKICYSCFADIKGLVYFDSNNDCKHDSLETNFVQDNLIHLMPEDIYTLTDSAGNFSFVKSGGIATIEYIPKISGAYLCNATSYYIVNLDNNTGDNDTLNFGLRIHEPVIDASCSIISGLARHTRYQNLILMAENLSTQKLFNNHLVLTLDSAFTFFYGQIAPDSIIGKKAYWHFDTLNPGQSVSFSASCEVTSGVMWDNYQHILSIFATGDAVPGNNHDTSSGIIIGSVDPNYKLANPTGIGPQHYIENDIPIDFYVEFQNTGTDTAFNIKIFDVLDEDLDIKTLKVKSSSHPMYYKLENRQLKFYFDNVLLVDSNKDYKKSIGYVTYSIMPKKSPDGTVITNTADIYFDFNDPITTNTTWHTIGRPGCYFENDTKNDFNFFPNPVNEENITVTVNIVREGNYQLVITNIAGKEVYRIASKDNKIGKYQHNVKLPGQMRAGVYFITLQTPKNNLSRKLILTN